MQFLSLNMGDNFRLPQVPLRTRSFFFYWRKNLWCGHYGARIESSGDKTGISRVKIGASPHKIFYLFFKKRLLSRWCFLTNQVCLCWFFKSNIHGASLRPLHIRTQILVDFFYIERTFRFISFGWISLSMGLCARYRLHKLPTQNIEIWWIDFVQQYSLIRIHLESYKNVCFVYCVSCFAWMLNDILFFENKFWNIQ